MKKRRQQGAPMMSKLGKKEGGVHESLVWNRAYLPDSFRNGIFVRAESLTGLVNSLCVCCSAIWHKVRGKLSQFMGQAMFFLGKNKNFNIFI